MQSVICAALFSFCVFWVWLRACDMIYHTCQGSLTYSSTTLASVHVSDGKTEGNLTHFSRSQMKYVKQTKAHVTGRNTLGNQTNGTPFILFKKQCSGLAVTLGSLEALRGAGLAASVWERCHSHSFHLHSVEPILVLQMDCNVRDW